MATRIELAAIIMIYSLDYYWCYLMFGFIILSQTISSVVIGLLQSNIYWYAFGGTPTKGMKHTAQFYANQLVTFL